MKKNFNILITAGPTWVPIDSVRVITTVFGGSLGVKIAEAAKKKGYNVTLLMGPGRVNLNDLDSGIRVLRYKYFDDLLRMLKIFLRKQKYVALIHSSAVADYQPRKKYFGKIKSGNNFLKISMKPTIKMVDLVKKIDPNIFLIKFKLEVGISNIKLISIAKRSMLQSKADMIVANDFNQMNNSHKAYILMKDGRKYSIAGKRKIAEKIIKLMSDEIKYK